MGADLGSQTRPAGQSLPPHAPQPSKPPSGPVHQEPAQASPAAGQLAPHAPQLWVVSSATHAPSQQVPYAPPSPCTQYSPAEVGLVQSGYMQAQSLQTWPGAQARPQVPQLLASLLRSMQLGSLPQQLPQMPLLLR